MKHSKQTTYRALAAYAEGAVTVSEAAALEDALASSPEARRRLVRINDVTSHLRNTAALGDIHLLPDLLPRLDRTRRSMDEASRRCRFSPRIMGLAAAAAVAAVLVSTVLLQKDAGNANVPEDEFRVKSAAPRGAVRSRWIAFNAFRLSEAAEPEQVHGTLHADDGLLFSYTNLGPEPFSYLMIFSVNANRDLYWYYPAFLDQQDNPRGIDIDKGVSRAGLREVIARSYAEGSLTIFGLFSDTVLSVSDIETAVAQGVTDSAGLEAAFEGVQVKSLTIQVTQ